MKLNTKILITLVILLFNTNLFANTPSKNATPPVTKEEKDVYTEDKLNIVVDAKHPQFVIKLKSNPTTGYSWFLREYDANIMTPVKHEFIAPQKVLMGAPGFETWTFRVKPQGFVVPMQATIRFIYARPWEGANNSTQTVFRVTTH